MLLMLTQMCLGMIVFVALNFPIIIIGRNILQLRAKLYSASEETIDDFRESS